MIKIFRLYIPSMPSPNRVNGLAEQLCTALGDFLRQTDDLSKLLSAPQE